MANDNTKDEEVKTNPSQPDYEQKGGEPQPTPEPEEEEEEADESESEDEDDKDAV